LRGASVPTLRYVSFRASLADAYGTSAGGVTRVGTPRRRRSSPLLTESDSRLIRHDASIGDRRRCAASQDGWVTETKMTNGTSGATVRLNYIKIRDVTTKDEEANGASTYVAVLPAAEIVKIGTDGNLRSYIPAHPGKKRNQVHKAIARTIRENSDRFSQLNSGFLIGASKISIDDNKRVATLRDASVNNGAQSQGEIQLYFDDCAKFGVDPIDFAIRCELSIEPDPSTRTNIAVARNTATRIEGISIAGKHGYFEGLNAAFQKVHPHLELARSETDVEDKYVDTRQLLQVLWAMMPEQLAPEHRRSMEARMRAYKNAAYCLQDFMEIFDKRESDNGNAARYAYFIDMAGSAWHEYLRWKQHAQWNDKRLFERLRQAIRSDDGAVKEIADGIVFPILSALSKFVKQGKGGRWKILYPRFFRDEDMLIAARRQLSACDGRPMLMGRSAAAYEALMMLTEMAEHYSAQAAVTLDAKASSDRAGPDSPLLDLSDAAVRKMIKLAKKRGWVTHDQISTVLPPVEVTSDQIEDVFIMLNEMGINVIEQEPHHYE